MNANSQLCSKFVTCVVPFTLTILDYVHTKFRGVQSEWEDNIRNIYHRCKPGSHYKLLQSWTLLSTLEQKLLARTVVFSHSIIKMLYPFTKEANKSQQKDLLSQCHLKDSDPQTHSSSTPCKQNDIARDSSEENGGLSLSQVHIPIAILSARLRCRDL